jgi:hypothetical protein
MLPNFPKQGCLLDEKLAYDVNMLFLPVAVSIPFLPVYGESLPRCKSGGFRE